jgi:hypothetical protein
MSSRRTHLGGVLAAVDRFLVLMFSHGGFLKPTLSDTNCPFVHTFIV